MKPKILIVDGHSMIFQWPELASGYAARGPSVRESLVRMLTALQDATDWTVAVVFDGRGPRASADEESSAIRVFYSKSGQTADAIIERLAAKYAADCDVTVATDDRLERLTVESFGAVSISSERLLSEIRAAEASVRQTIRSLKSRR
jgi:predicted RNA-binding protein with PIN domain